MVPFQKNFIGDSKTVTTILYRIIINATAKYCSIASIWISHFSILYTDSKVRTTSYTQDKPNTRGSHCWVGFYSDFTRSKMEPLRIALKNGKHDRKERLSSCSLDWIHRIPSHKNVISCASATPQKQYYTRCSHLRILWCKPHWWPKSDTDGK